MRSCRVALLSSLFLVPLLRAQVSGNNIITTVAGADWAFPARVLPALQAPVDHPSGFSLDAQGNLYFADYNPRLVMRLSRDGIIRVIAGTGINVINSLAGLGGPAEGASLDQVVGTAVDSAGNVYIASQAGLVLKISPDGTIKNIAGVAYRFGFAGDDGPALQASFSGLSAIAIDGSGTIYVADTNNNRVRRISPNGIVQTAAGSGKASDPVTSGVATSAGLSAPLAVAVDPSGDLYIGDSGGRLIKVTTDGNYTTLATGLDILAITVDSSGNVLVLGRSLLRKVAPNKSVTSIAGNGICTISGDSGPAIKATICTNGFGGVAVDQDGSIYVANTPGIRQITPDGNIKTIAGNGGYLEVADGSPGLVTPLDAPGRIGLDSKGNMYIAEKGKSRVRKLDTSGRITTVADGAALGLTANAVAQFGGLTCLKVDGHDNVFAGTGDGRVLEIAPSGSLTLRWPTGTTVKSGNGAVGIAIDSRDNLYVSDGLFIRKITPEGTVSTFAGIGKTGWDGDGGPALQASLDARQLTFDPSGNLYVWDCNDNLVNTCRIRRIASDGTITAFYGNGQSGSAADGTLAVNGPLLTSGSGVGFFDITSDAAGNIYVGESGRIRVVGANGIVKTIAGNGSFTDSGDGGPAINATFYYPSGIVIDKSGNVFFSATQTGKIRKILVQTPSIQVNTQSLSFAANSQGVPPPVQTFLVSGSVLDLAFTVSSTASATWLKVVAGDPQNASQGATSRLVEVSADPSQLAPGEYAATITVSSNVALPAQQTVQVRFSVGTPLPATLRVDKNSLSFAFPRSASARSQTLVVSNPGSGQLAFTAAASTTVSPSWLSVSPASGIATPATSATISIQANPAGLPPGTYRGTVTISSATTGTSKSIPVTLTISSSAQGMLLSLTGMSFLAVAGGGVVPPQSFGVLNIGTGDMDWTVSTSTLSGGSWLSATPASGITTADGLVPSVQASATPAGLAPGRYYGLVRLNSTTAANSPQVVTVTLEVLPADSTPGSVVQPNALQFQLPAGQSSTSARELIVYNLNGSPVSFNALLSGPGAGLYRIYPGTSVISPDRPERVVVAPINIFGRPPGSLPARLVLQFDDGSVRTVDLQLAIIPAPVTAAARAASGCTPTQLAPALNTLGQSFSVTAGWPVALGVNVADDCGNPLTSGSVTVSFSNGDAPLSLQSLKDGRWQTTWQPSAATQASGVTLTVRAADPTAQITGTRAITGGFRAQQDPPLLGKDSVVSAAAPVSFVPLAPGGMISIYGSRLADNVASAASIPLPTQMANAQVIIAGQLAPLLYTSDGQINAVVPSGINANTPQQILVQRGLTYSQPVSLDVASTQPGIFSSGGAGIFIAYRTDGTAPFLVTRAAPARAGDILVGYCAGLGATDPAVPDGAASPTSPLASTVNPVTATIGGTSATVAFAGLVPGFVGLYQLNTQVPSGVQLGDAVPVTISVGGQTSAPVALAIR